MNIQYIFLVPLIPLVCFIVLGLFGKNFRKSAGIIGTLALLATTIISLVLAAQYFFDEGKVNGAYRKIVVLDHTWLQFSEGISINMGLILDPISMMMIVVAREAADAVIEKLRGLGEMPIVVGEVL